MNTSIYDISSKSFHNLYAILFGFVFWFIILTVIAVTMVTKLQFPEGAVYGPVRRERFWACFRSRLPRHIYARLNTGQI